MPKQHSVQQHDGRVREILDLTHLEAELEDGYLSITLPVQEIRVEVLADFARETRTRMPDALVDRLYHATRQHMVLEALGDCVTPSER